jgi:hypothetical protein
MVLSAPEQAVIIQIKTHTQAKYSLALGLPRTAPRLAFMQGINTKLSRSKCTGATT